MNNQLSAEEMRQILKRISKGEVRPEDLSTGEPVVEMWAEDQSDPQYLRMFYPENNKRIKKEDAERRAILARHLRVTLNIA
jgi:hypothetical protein